MKKYLLGFTAIALAIAFSSFTKPFATNTFKLLSNPNAANIVNDDAQWSTAGILQGQCDVSPVDLACTIKTNVNDVAYFHTVGTDKVLNTFSYANSQNPKQDYIEITEATGKNLGGGVFLRIISAVQAKHYNTTTSAYENATLSSLAFVNARQ
jgi:hypothetical protein